MKIDLIITIVVSLICSFSNVFYAQNNIDGKSISSFKYEKLKKQDAERFLKLEQKRITQEQLPFTLIHQRIEYTKKLLMKIEKGNLFFSMREVILMM